MLTRTDKQISRKKVLKLITKHQMQNLTLAEIEDYVEKSLKGKNKAQIKKKLYKSIKYFYAGHTNGFLSDIYKVLTNKTVEVVGKVAKYYKCNCCGYYSLSDNEGWDICQHCNWEDTSVDDNINRHCGCNYGSIREYRQHMLDNPNIYYKEKWLKDEK